MPLHDRQPFRPGQESGTLSAKLGGHLDGKSGLMSLVLQYRSTEHINCLLVSILETGA